MRCCIGLENYPGCIQNMKSFAIFTIQFTHFFSFNYFKSIAGKWYLVKCCVNGGADFGILIILNVVTSYLSGSDASRDGNTANRLGQSTESDLVKWSIGTFATASRQLLQLLVTRTNSTEFVFSFKWAYECEWVLGMLISWIVLCRNSSKRTHGIHACHYMRCYADYGRRSNRKKQHQTKQKTNKKLSKRCRSLSFCCCMHFDIKVLLSIKVQSTFRSFVHSSSSPISIISFVYRCMFAHFFLRFVLSLIVDLLVWCCWYCFRCVHNLFFASVTVVFLRIYRGSDDVFFCVQHNVQWKTKNNPINPSVACVWLLFFVFVISFVLEEKKVDMTASPFLFEMCRRTRDMRTSLLW